MTQTTFASNATPSLTLLDQNFTQLYYLRELISDPSYTAATPKLTIDASGNFGFGVSPGGRVSIRASGGSYDTHFAFGANFDNYLTAGPSGVQIFRRNTTEDARFDASGDWLVGTTSAGSPNPGVSTLPVGQVLIGNNAQATGWNFQQFQRSTVVIGSISQSGTTAVLYNTTSDERLKKNIVDAPDAGSIIDSIKVRSFDWREAENEHVTHGFIAQELVTVAPQAVKVGDDGPDVSDTWAVDPSKLVPLLVKGWQSQQREIADLKARLAAAGI